jgi:uncharacterized protein involved in exopolysaccharide biosynthesis
MANAPEPASELANGKELDGRGRAEEPRAHGGQDASLVRALNVLLRYRRSIVLLPLLGLVAGGLTARLKTPTYTADAAFLVQGDDGGGAGLAGIAAQLGVNVSQAAVTPKLYADLLTSRLVLGGLANTRFDFTSGGRRHRGTIAELYEVEPGPPAQRAEQVRRILSGNVSAQTDLATGVVSYRVTAPWPELAEQIAARLQEALVRFTLTTRQSQAGAERVFAEARLAEARAQLRQAEDELQYFLQRNRSYENSPRLAFQSERLQRDVLSRQTLVATLEQAYHSARLSEVRDTPVLTVIEGPAGSARRDSRGTLVRGFMGLVLGLMLAVGAAFVRDFLRTSRQIDTPEMREFASLRRDALRIFPARRPAS